MSHSIIPFSSSNLLEIKNDQYILIQDESYTKTKLISYDFDTNELSEMKITKPFSAVFNDYNGPIQIITKYGSFSKKERANIEYESDWGENPTYEYENINDYPELKIFLAKSQDHGHLKIYGNDNNYHLDVWHSQAYVISLNDKITAFHIDETYMLQEGDCNTFVWNFDDNFVVYNDGAVYSVVIIVKN
jgi:hypothetical protein